ncbi:MAG: zf-HC2 domain-containing protein [Oscillospiraceae bacterium]|jgi:hypothetical protein|nr:zf-HC2 domain-containing protein [Oscillospiraceae bacterium]
MNRCDIEAVSALLDGELSETDAALLREHMEDCPSCRALYQDFLAMRDGFAGLEENAPDTLVPGTVYRYGLGEEPPRRRRVVASLLGVAACLAAVWLVSTQAEPRPSATSQNDIESVSEEAGVTFDAAEPADENGYTGGANDTMPAPAAPEAPAALPEPELSFTEDNAAPPKIAGTDSGAGEAPETYADTPMGGATSGVGRFEEEGSQANVAEGSPPEPSPSPSPSPD